MEHYKESPLGLIPKDWEIRKLGELLNVNTGAKNAQDATSNGEFPFFTRSVNTQRINSFSHDTEALLIAGEGIFKVKHYSGKFDVHQRTYVLTAKDKLNSSLKFLQNQIQSRIIKLIDTSVGSTVQSLRKPIIQELKLVIPPLVEQLRIAEILSTVDDKIEIIDQQIIENQELKKALMQRLLTKGIGHTEFKDSALGMIPKSWEVMKLSKICDVRDGTHDSPKYLEKGIPFVTSKNLTDTVLSFDNIKYISNKDHSNFSKRSHVENGDILFGMIGTVGKPIIVQEKFEFSIKNVALLKFSGNQLLNNVFAKNILKSSVVLNQFKKISNGGVLNFIALGSIRNLDFPLPSKTEQQKIAEILNSVDDKLEVLLEKKTHYQELKQGLMQQLLTGKIRVKV